MSTDKADSERGRLGQYYCPEIDSRVDAPTGVLLSDQIKHYATSFKMIDPFHNDQLKPAGYELTIGDEFVLGGQRHELKKDGEIRIPPFNVAVIKTAETVNLPRFLIARWNIRVKWAYEGLLWVGGPQVDPGWVGHLFCPLYNLSDKEVVLRFKDPIALMDFVTTSTFTPGSSVEYERPPKRVLLQEYTAAELKSALYTEAKRRIDDIEGKTQQSVERLEKRMEFFVGAGLVIITVLVAALAVIYTYGKETSVPIWQLVDFAIAGLALLVAFLAHRRIRRQ